MNNKIIANVDGLDPWKFPFSREDVQRIRISVEPGLVRWYLPQDLYDQMPDEMELLYTNIYGHLLVISSCEDDLMFLHRRLTRGKRRSTYYRHMVYPNTDDSITRKKRYRGKKVGLILKVRTSNLALRREMEDYTYTLDEPVVPHIAMGRYLVVRSKSFLEHLERRGKGTP